MYVRTYSNLNTLSVERLSQSLPLLSYPSSSFIYAYILRFGGWIPVPAWPIRVLSACDSDTGTQKISIKYRTISTGSETADFQLPRDTLNHVGSWDNNKKQNDQSLCFR